MSNRSQFSRQNLPPPTPSLHLNTTTSKARITHPAHSIHSHLLVHFNSSIFLSKSPPLSMAATLETFLPRINPNPNSPLNRTSMASSTHFSPSLRFDTAFRRRPQSQLTSVASLCVSPKGLGTRFLSIERRKSKNQPVLATSFEASHEDDSKHTEIEVEEGKSKLEAGAKEAQEEWEQVLESFKEKAIKMQGISQEAYELYSKKATVVLTEASEKLKIQAEKTRKDLSVIAKEISEGGKEYLDAAAEKSPEEVKDIVETFASSTDDLKEVSKVRDFYLGIPYGALLSVGGFLSFMIFGNVSAIRFGVILGGVLLALSISSLRLWKKGESSDLTLKGQAAIASIIFLRDLWLLSQRSFFQNIITTLISGAMMVFYLYRISVDGGKNEGPSTERRLKN